MKYFRRYAFCIPVLGKDQSAIYNLQKGQIKLIPNSMVEAIEQLDANPVAEIISELHEDSIEIFESYLQFLIENDLGFLTDEPALFPAIDFQTWDSPEMINNAIIEYSQVYDFDLLCQQLNNLLCKYLEIRVESLDFSEHEKIVRCFEGTLFRSISIVAAHHPSLTEEKLGKLCNKEQRVSRYIIYKAPSEFREKAYPRMRFTVKDVSQQFTEHFPQDSYYISLPFFRESKLFNPYYNKKVCIASDGSIKNCLMHTKSYGNLAINSLDEVINQESFRALWHASHDKILGIKDSPLRYCQLYSSNLRKTDKGLYEMIP